MKTQSLVLLGKYQDGFFFVFVFIAHVPLSVYNSLKPTSNPTHISFLMNFKQQHLQKHVLFFHCNLSLCLRPVES